MYLSQVCPLFLSQCSELTLNSEFYGVLVYKLGINRAVCLCFLFVLLSFVRCDECQAGIVIFIIKIRLRNVSTRIFNKQDI